MMKSFLNRLSKVISSDSNDSEPESTATQKPQEAEPATLPKDSFADKPKATSKKKAVQKKTTTQKSPSKKATQTTAKASPVETSSKGKGMQPICFFFEAHQPNRLKPYSFFDIGNDPFYEDDDLNRQELDDACEKCYLPANEMMAKLIEEGKGQFKISLSVSGVLLEQLEAMRPDVLKSFQELHATGGVEIVAETYYHSMNFHRSKKEFAAQVEKQVEKIQEVFGVKPKAFRHTACIYFNELAAYVEGLGFESMLGEAVGHVLNGREANYLYCSPNCKSIKAHLRNGILTDDLAFRFGNHAWPEHPLTSEKFANWCQGNGGEVINIFMDYESIGQHQDASTGIFEFFKAFPGEWEKLGGRFVTVSEAAKEFEVVGDYDCHDPTSWAHEQKDLSAWKGNNMQEEARRKILIIEELVKSKNDPEFLHQWRKMQTAEHFYYMSTKTGEAGKVHERLRPYKTPYDAYLYFMNALTDLQIRLEAE